MSWTELNPGLTIAFIAAGAAIVTALIGILTAVVAAKVAFRSNRALEQLKYNLNKISSLRELENTQFEKSIDALDGALSSIQHLKSQLQLVLMATSQSMSSKEVRDRVELARESLFGSYDLLHPQLLRIEREAFHRAKAIAVSVRDEVFQIFDQEASLPLSDRQKIRLRELRFELSEEQHRMLDSKTSRIARRTSEISMEEGHENALGR